MILPIIAYGHPVLKKKAINLEKDYANLESLLVNMWETMYNANGVGLAAPQIGLGVRLFLVDTEQLYDGKDDKEGIKKVFINAQIIEETGEPWSYEEGCLSIPHIRGDVERQGNIVIEYYDEKFKKHREEYNEVDARVIQHEYDHIEGLLFTEKLKPLKKRLIKRRLDSIRKGNVKTDYRMKFFRG